MLQERLAKLRSRTAPALRLQLQDRQRRFAHRKEVRKELTSQSSVGVWLRAPAVHRRGHTGSRRIACSSLAAEQHRLCGWSPRLGRGAPCITRNCARGRHPHIYNIRCSSARLAAWCTGRPQFPEGCKWCDGCSGRASRPRAMRARRKRTRALKVTKVRALGRRPCDGISPLTPSPALLRRRPAGLRPERHLPLRDQLPERRCSAASPSWPTSAPR